MNDPTIFAPASGGGRAGIAVIRVSGADCAAALRRLAGGGLPEPRRATRVSLADPATGEVLDEALALWFPAPASYTGEDVAELHLHGGPAVVSSLLEALGGCPGLRPAAPGEFTRRAFINGKLDLTAAEGLADLVNAETEAQRRQALRQMQGELGRLYEDWRQRLLGAVTQLEAAIDFSDQDLGGASGAMVDKVRREIAALAGDIDAHLSDGRRGERLREGVHLAIVGPPNVGKSSLLNLLARRDAAIVSADEGTTRDVIEVHLDLGGYPAVVADTAGLRAPGGAVETEGVRRALRRAEDADLKLAVLDPGTLDDRHLVDLVDDDTIVLINKIDLDPAGLPGEIQGRRALAISVHSGQGIDAMMAVLEREIAEKCRVSGPPSLTRSRHRLALVDCRQALERALRTAVSELAAEDLRLASRALGRITGRVDVEDILDAIFENFCIGK